MPAFALTPAARHKALILMEGNYLLGFGSRAPHAASDLLAHLYGAVAPGP
jgi:iron complex transport system substrate-binding protein